MSLVKADGNYRRRKRTDIVHQSGNREISRRPILIFGTVADHSPHFGKLGIYDKSYGQMLSDAAFMHRVVNLGRKTVEIKYAIGATNIKSLSDYRRLLRSIEYLLADAHARGEGHVF